MGNNIFLRIIVPCVLCCVLLMYRPIKVVQSSVQTERRGRWDAKWKRNKKGEVKNYITGAEFRLEIPAAQHSMQESKKNLKQTLSTTPKYTAHNHII